MEKKSCPNCRSADYHYSGYAGCARCNSCGYSTRRADFFPPIPAPMERVDTTSPEWRARVSAHIAEKGYLCCGSKIEGEHVFDCRYTKTVRETFGT